MEWIDETIVGLIDAYSTTDVYELCDCLGIEIKRVDKNSIVLFGKDAIYDKNEDDTEVIYVRNDLSPNRKRFAITHELGHALFHSDLLGLNLRFMNTGKIDREANYFAFKLNNIDIDKYQIKTLSAEQLTYVIGMHPDFLDMLMNS